MPTPMPRKMAPPARPRRELGTCGRIVAAASTMMAPPAMPDARRQPKNQPMDSGRLHAAKARVTSAIMARRTCVLEKRRARGWPMSAPMR
ncbi:hypothetical protein D3C75_1104270 [compost metagenome]